MRTDLQQVFHGRAAVDRLPVSAVPGLVTTARPILEAILARHGRAPGICVAAICGAQGSGKTTLTSGLVEALRSAGVAAVAMSMDDFYFSRAARDTLARQVHPLLRTRGVPGTHDLGRARQAIEELAAAGPGDRVALPAFDKARDDRVPPDREPQIAGQVDVLVLEGWCIGAAPQDEAALAMPVNALEREEDADGVWRRYVNAQLAGDYAGLFARLDLVVLLKAPSFEQVYSWRREQEEKLRARIAEGQGRTAGAAAMDDAALARFIRHYERLTRHILEEMPARADLMIELDERRQPVRVTARGATRRRAPAPAPSFVPRKSLLGVKCG